MGDELILLGTIRILQEQNNEVIVSAYNPERLQSFFAQFPDLKPITVQPSAIFFLIRGKNS